MAIDAGSTAFIFVCMAMVQLMTPGLAFFYAGLVRDTSVITMMIQNFAAIGIITIIWYLYLYSLCFSPDSWGFFGNPGTYAAFAGVETHVEGPAPGIPHLLFAGYQGMFAVITPALMTGCFADRFRFGPYIIFIVLWSTFVYAPFCHWVWGGGWMAQWGVYDFAGGIVVHITAGFSALATLLVVGKRQVPEGLEEHEMDTPHSIPTVALGTALLWFGWFGFNGGSALGSGGLAVVAGVNSQIAGSIACFTWLLIDWAKHKKPSLVGLCVGAIAGLATVTPAAGFIQPWAAGVIGIVAACFCYGCCELRKKLGIDDALDVWGVHGMGGFLGTILLGVLADGPECADVAVAPTWCVNPGTAVRSAELLGKQTAAAFLTAAYSFIVTFLMVKGLSIVMNVVPDDEHLTNLDLHMHGEQHTPPKSYQLPPVDPPTLANKAAVCPVDYI